MANPNPYQAGPPFAPPVVKPTNPYATSSLVYGGIIFAATIILGLFGYAAIGVTAIYSIYLAIRGLVKSASLPGNLGLWPSLGGFVLGIFSFVLTLLFNLGYLSISLR